MRKFNNEEKENMFTKNEMAIISKRLDELQDEAQEKLLQGFEHIAGGIDALIPIAYIEKISQEANQKLQFEACMQFLKAGFKVNTYQAGNILIIRLSW